MRSREGLDSSRRSACAAIRTPGVQKPHCSALVSTKALCSSSISRESERPSTVSTLQPSACAANAVLAADVRAGELELVAKEVGEVEPRGHAALHALAVDSEGDFDGFGDVSHLLSSSPRKRGSSVVAKSRCIPACAGISSSHIALTLRRLSF